MIKQFSGLSYEDKGGVWSINFRKPLWGTAVCINKKFLHLARKNRVTLELSCPGGYELINPAMILKNGKLIKTNFHYETPMELIRYEIEAIDE